MTNLATPQKDNASKVDPIVVGPEAKKDEIAKTIPMGSDKK